MTGAVYHGISHESLVFSHYVTNTYVFLYSATYWRGAPSRRSHMTIIQRAPVIQPKPSMLLLQWTKEDESKSSKEGFALQWSKVYIYRRNT